MSGFIAIRNWRKFQHYDPAKRRPLWIKNYTELLDDENYLKLSSRQRGILHAIWLAAASTRSVLGSSPARLGRIIGDPTVRRRDITSLSHAGYIRIFASKELAERYQDASPEVEKEKEEKPLRSSRPEGNGEGIGFTIDKDLLRDIR